MRNAALHFPAGWPLRHFSLHELASLVSARKPPLLELSKDFVDAVSLKELAKLLDRVRAESDTAVSFAGTTNLVGCGGFGWNRYRSYLAVQTAQAHFLNCCWFRAIVGAPLDGVDEDEVVDRIQQLSEDLAPIRLCIEVHGGLESDLGVLGRMLRMTDVDVVVDVDNMRRAGLRRTQLFGVLPPARVAYFHVRNLPGVRNENPALDEDERDLQKRFPDAIFLWEPKTVEEPRAILECLGEY